MKRFIRVRQAAATLQVARSTLYLYVQRGVLPPLRHLSPRVAGFDGDEFDAAVAKLLKVDARDPRAA
ncbi:MAG: helix-turn-helix transcriptional regulator [Gammaproteobacteria bacterium]